MALHTIATKCFWVYAFIMEIFLFVPVLLLFIVGSIYWTSRRSNSVIENWAARNDYRLLEAQQSILSKGPFFWTTSDGQTVYRVTVEDSAGQTRRGWVRCGSWLGGLLSEQIEVRWDDE